MRRLLYILSFFALPASSFSQDHQELKATVETMASTFNFQGDTLAGATCFLVNKDGQQYFVTAAHLFKSSHKSGDTVLVRMLIQNELKPFDATVYFHANKDIDIAVFKLSEKVTQSIKLLENVSQGHGISLDTTLVGFGMPVFFYGFPLTNMGTEALGIKFPLVKKAIVSGVVKYNRVEVLVLDGHNNVGFSGGPVVAYDSNLKKMCTIGVVSGYFSETKNVEYKGDKLSFDENSGILLCYGRQYVEEILATIEKPSSMKSKK
ncbi:S1 family peptidase [Terrimonas pollutisoli]|uniref:S1 family peptidase n=1 Tax=Terrimonas pollutisoli TaxID=3034147 RepID=UPI0023EE239E|nr:serine protease [Terrimonas sp. H1YJ31]